MPTSDETLPMTWTFLSEVCGLLRWSLCVDAPKLIGEFAKQADASLAPRSNGSRLFQLGRHDQVILSWSHGDLPTIDRLKRLPHANRHALR
jgi:hypothetical protein